MVSFRSLRLIALCLAPALLATTTLGCDRGGGGPVRIGVAGSFSDPIGIPMQLAAELAAAEINAAGGIAGRPLELVEQSIHRHARV